MASRISRYSKLHTNPQMNYYRIRNMADPQASEPGAAAAAPAEEPQRPLGPDGKPIPGLAEINAIKAEKKMKKQQEQVEEVICIMHKNVENV